MRVALVLTVTIVVVEMACGATLSKKELKPLPVEQFIEEVIHSFLTTKLSSDEGMEGTISKVEKIMVPWIVEKLTSLVDSGEITTISELERRIESLVKDLDVSKVLEGEQKPNRRDDDEPNYLDRLYGGFGK